MLDQLSSWKAWKKHFESCAVCFHRPYLRRRFCRGCLSHADKDIVDLFEVSIPNMDGGRAWTIMVQLLTYFGEREEHIKGNWDEAKMASVNHSIDEEEVTGESFKDTSVHVQRATEAFMSEDFWAMVALARIFAGWLAALMYWCLGCPCHSRRFRDFFEMHQDNLRCPLRTCMAPNIAAGEMDRFQIRLAEEARAAVVVITLRPLLTPEQRAKILDEFAVGSEFIEVEYQLRIQSGWQGIPLKTLITGHENLELVIRGLISCLAQFEAIQPENYSSCCLFTLRLLCHGTPLRAQIICLIQRTHSFSELPGLKRIRTASQHVPCLEQSIERRHATINASGRAAPNHSVQYDSIHGLRKGELLDIFDDTPERIRNFAATFDKTARSPAQCLQSLGLHTHPNVTQYLKDSGEGLAVPHDVAAEVVYRADYYSQTLKYPAFAKPPVPPVPPFTRDGSEDVDGDF